MLAHSLVALSALSAAIYLLWGCRQSASLAKTIVKTASIGGLAIAGLFLDAPFLLVLALGFSALGDGFLAFEDDRSFLLGMAAFFAAHLAYIPLFLAQEPGFDSLSQRVLFAPIILIFAGVMYRILWPGLGAFRLPVAGYTMAISLMGIAALDLPSSGNGLWVLVGAYAFILSDSILAIEKFHLAEGAPMRRITPYGVWFFYWTGQAMIAFGVLS